MDDTSTFVPNREGTSLHLNRNNETVVSGMTECSWETPSVASHGSSAEAARYTSTSLPPSRYRGGTGSRFGLGGSFRSGSSVSSGQRSYSSRGGRSRGMDRSTRSGISALFFDPIAEEVEGDEASTHGGGDGASIKSGRSALGSGSGGGGGLGGRSVGGSVGSMRFLHREHLQSGRLFGTSGLFSADEQSVVSGISMSSKPPAAPDSSVSERSVNSRPTVIPFGTGPDTVVSGGDRTFASNPTRSVSSKPVVIPFGSGPDTVVSGDEKRGADGGRKRRASVDSRSSAVSQRDRPAAPFGRDSIASQNDSRSVCTWGYESVAVSRHGRPGKGPDEEAASITHEERQEIALAAFDNTRYATHEPKVEATREVDVSAYQDLIVDADEVTSLPEDYVLDSFGNRFHPKEDPEQETRRDVRSDRPEFELFSVADDTDDPYEGPFSKRRKWYSVVTICAAIVLAMLGIGMSVRALSSDTVKYETNEARLDDFGSGYVYLLGHQFGGGVGGLVGGLENERRIQLARGGYGATLGGRAPPATSNSARGAGYAPVSAGPGRGSVRPALSSVNFSTGAGARTYSGGRGSQQLGLVAAPRDPFGGFGPPQFHPGHSAGPGVPSLTAAPLTSYTPPPNDEGIIVVLDPRFNGAFIDLSVLPYNPALEMPVILDVPFSGGGAAREVFGRCLKLVQCSKEGAEILARERELEAGGSESVGRRRLMASNLLGEEQTRRLEQEGGGEENTAPVNVHPMFIADARKDQMNNPEEELILVEKEISQGGAPNAPPFDPPLRMEVVYASTYVNVDCTTPPGIDRGIAKNLVTSNMADVIYSPDMHDVARLFAPPLQAYGRAVAMVRHPIARAVAEYERRKERDAEVKKMTLEEFARSDHLKDNILTKAIAGRDDLAIAKEILKRKFLVGLFDRMDASIERLEIFLHWNNIGNDVRACQREEVVREMAEPHNHDLELPLEGSPTWISLMEKNGLDMVLFDYAKFLFDYQGHALFGIPASS